MPLPFRRFVGAALVACAAAPALAAQLTPDRADPGAPVAGIGIALGGVGMDTDALNAALRARGRATVATSMPTATLEAWVRVKRVVLSTTAQSYVARRAEATFFDTETSGGSASIDLGIPLVASRGWLVYPMAGVGASRLEVALRQRGAATFEEINAAPAIDTDLSAWRVQGHVGAGLVRVVRPSWWNVQLTLDARGGYVAPLGDTEWRRGRWAVTEAPEVGQRGLYARVGVGLVLARRTYAIAPMVLSMLPYVSR